MKIFSNYITGNNRVNKVHSQNFGNNEPGTNRANIAQNTNISNVTPDYNISKPIAYKKIEEIQLPNDLKANVYKLANGQRVVIIPKNGTTVVKSYVNTGSLNEPDKLRGISHFIEHNLFNGSEALGDKVFFDEVNKMGAVTNASTSFSVTDYYIVSQLLEDTDLENKIKLHAGMLQSPKFLTEKLEKEKKIVDSEINMCLSDDSSRAETITLKKLFNINTKAPDLVAGSTDNIDALTRDDVINYFNNNYYPANMVTVITGEVEPEKTMELVSKYFNSNKVPNTQRLHEKLIPTDKAIRTDLISKKNQGAAQIYLGFAGPENGNAKDKIKLRAVNQLLGGLANSRIKNLEQKYSTSVDFVTERLGTRESDPTALLFGIGTAEEYVEPFLKDFYSVLDNLSKQPPTPEEFLAIKNQIKKTNAVYMQSSEALNQHIGMDFLNGTPYNTSTYNNEIDKLTYQDFIDTAKKYYNLNKASLTVVHPSNTTEETINKNYNSLRSHSSVAFTGATKKIPINLNETEEYTMANNFDVVLKDEKSDIVNYSLTFANPKWAPHKAALGDVLCDMLQNCGTNIRSKDKLDSVYDQNGIRTGISAGANTVALFSDFLAKDTVTATNLIKEQIQNINFTQKDFENAIQHCRDYYANKEPSAIDNYSKAIYKNTNISYTTEEKLKSLGNITLEDIKSLYNEILLNGQGTVTVTGPFSKYPELKQQIFNSAGAFNAVKPKDVSIPKSYIPIDKVQVYTTETKRNQAEIFEGFKFQINGNLKDTLCLQILQHILGGSSSSRLFSDLREKRHLAYLVSANYSNVNDIGVIGLRIKTTTNNTETGEKSYDNIKKSIDGFNENIYKISTEKVSEEELEQAKKALKNDFLAGVEMDSVKARILAASSNSPYGLNFLNEKFNEIDKITTEDILNTAKYVFKNKPVYSISGTKDALEANKEYLETLSN